MLVIDGQNFDIKNTGLENLEQVFDLVREQGYLDDRVVTEVFLNKEIFTEIYPHQSEDIALSEVESVEINTMSSTAMAMEITRELYKVVTLMGNGGRSVADLFRQADDAEALETYQDLIDVTRNFLSMFGMLREQYSLKDSDTYSSLADEMSDLFTEMTEVIENEDWILLADLMEYEYIPLVERWKQVVADLRDGIRVALKKQQ